MQVQSGEVAGTALTKRNPRYDEAIEEGRHFGAARAFWAEPDLIVALLEHLHLFQLGLGNDAD